MGEAERATSESADRTRAGGQARHIGVIGAGAAGLSAAWLLQSEGHAVTLYERRATAGGRMRTDELEGIRFDPSVQLLGSHYTELFGLARAAGVPDLLVKSPGRDAVWRKGRVHELTYGSVSSMIRSSALPTGLKLKLGARYLPFLARHGKLDLHDLTGTGGLELDDESIGVWGGRELGEDFVDLLAYPLLGAYYGSEPEDTSAALYHALARVGMDVSVFAVRGGMSGLMQGVAAALSDHGADSRFNSAVERLEADDRSVRVHDGASSTAFDAVVLAVPAPEAARLLARSPAADWLAQVRTAPTCTLALALEQPGQGEFFGLTVPRTVASAIVAVCVQERKNAGLVPAGRSALVVCPAPGQAAALAAARPAQVLERMLPDVERMLPGTRASVQRARVTYFPEGNPVFYPGYLRHLQGFRAAVLPDRVVLAGDYLVAPTVEGAVRSGAAAARRLLASFRA